MKRPFAFIGVISFLSAVILCDTDVSAVRVAFLAASAAFLCSFCISLVKRKPVRILLLSFAVLIVSFSVYCVMQGFVRLANYNEKTVSISGTVTNADYYGNYEKLKIRVNSVNGQKERFYIVAYNNVKSGLSSGDKINADTNLRLFANDGESIESSFADSEFLMTNKLLNVTVTGENKYYRAVGKLSTYYKNSIRAYLPNTLSAVAIGMTVGDTDGISTYLRNCFNYSGSAHLLVVSGLHLTIWMLFLSKFFPILHKKKILDFAVSGIFVFLYLALTGFSVSVIRAGVMLMIIKLANLLGKSSDSVNSLGLAVTVLLAINPFYIYSSSFLLSVGSTLGLVLYAGKIHNYLYARKFCKPVIRYFAGRLILDSIAVSISVSVFTVPVFIIKFNMFPILSFVTNILVVDLASVLMLFAVVGVILKSAGLNSAVKYVFYMAGKTADIIIYTAEKIGMRKYSTVAVSSRFFKYFLLIAVLIATGFYILKRYKKIRKIILPITLAALFLFTAAVSQFFELSHPSIDVRTDGSVPLVLVRDGYDNILLGTNGDGLSYKAGNMLGRHNLKTVGSLYTAETDNYTYSKIETLINSYPTENILFKESSPVQGDFKNCREYVKSVTLNNCITVRPISNKTVAVFTPKADILISCEKYPENLFDFDDKYDIIILSTSAYECCSVNAAGHLKNKSSQIIELTDNQITIYPDIGKIYYTESF